MIVVDTNVLVRYLVDDDPVQSPRARSFMENELTKERPGFVALISLVELAWVLRKAYRASAEAIVEVIEELLDAPQIVVEQADVVERALSTPHPDLADQLIRSLGEAHRCTKTVTFDKNFAKLSGVELLTA